MGCSITAGTFVATTSKIHPHNPCALPITCQLVSEISHLPVAPTLTEVKVGGEVVDRHQHEDHQLIYVSAGVISIDTAHGSWVVSRDRALWVPAGTWHQHRFYGRSVFHTVRIPVRGTPPLPADSPAVVGVNPLLRELVIAYTAGRDETDLAATPSPTPHGHEQDREARRIFRVILDHLHRAPTQPMVLPAPTDPRLAAACRIVDADLSRAYPLHQLATEVSTSERTLSRLFRAEFGMTYPQWRNRARTLTAMILLADGASVTHTAHTCGWATTSAFIDTFSRIMGVTPGTHRAGVRTDL